MKKQFLLILFFGVAVVPPVFAADLDSVPVASLGEMRRTSDYPAPGLECNRAQSGRRSVDTATPSEKVKSASLAHSAESVRQ